MKKSIHIYDVSKQQRFVFHTWERVVPYSTVQFPVYITNPYNLTYRIAGYIRSYTYSPYVTCTKMNIEVGGVTQPQLPNIQLYGNNDTVTLP